MKRWNPLLTTLASALLLGASFAPARAATSVSLDLRIGAPYPKGELRFVQRPDVELVPNTRVYYVRNADYDVFRYGKYWYLCDDGVWFRSRTINGRFLHVEFSSVPRQVVFVPQDHWKHWKDHPGNARGHYKNREDRRDVVVIDRHGKTHTRESR